MRNNEINSQQRRRWQFPHLVRRHMWQPAAAKWEAWCPSCRSCSDELWLLPATPHRLVGFKGVQAGSLSWPVLILALPLDGDSEEIDWPPLLWSWNTWGFLLNVSHLSRALSAPLATLFLAGVPFKLHGKPHLYSRELQNEKNKWKKKKTEHFKMCFELVLYRKHTRDLYY